MKPRRKTPAPSRIGSHRPPLERMLRIHQALAAGTHPNASTIAADLEVCTKTIHRDLEFMRDRLGLPLAFVAAHNGYHYTESVESFPAMQISEGELFALL
ncbi:MAG: DNA-binding protein, partial [Pedosphaera sp.]|nr:DNA-binding protein [Pedosphaera sp.]